MKYVSLFTFLVICAAVVAVGTLSAEEVKSSASASEDIGLLFDGDDALDNVTVDGCGHDIKDLAKTPESSAIQVYYQSALLYMLSTYFSAKKFIISYLPWTYVSGTPATPNAAA